MLMMRTRTAVKNVASLLPRHFHELNGGVSSAQIECPDYAQPPPVCPASVSTFRTCLSDFIVVETSVRHSDRHRDGLWRDCVESLVGS